MHRLPTIVSVCALVMLCSSTLGTRHVAYATGSSTLTRSEDPVVLTGADVPSLQGIPPGDLVAFKYTTGWIQVPVQVDERTTKDFGLIYNDPASGITAPQYTDAATFTGADPNPMFDSDDEIAFMAKDAGGTPPSFSEPAGVIANTGVQLTITDPLAAGQTGYVYLFRSGTLSPGAGQSYVAYNFSLNSGAYLTTYNKSNGPNLENTTITSPFYTHHFLDRWADDRLTITAGASTGVDILDRHKSLFAPGTCTRSEDTFDSAEGAFVINKSGPVRAIRSYLGANSGPLTQREHIFYAQRQDMRTFLRVHDIAGILDFFDYSPAASGMTYYDNLNTGGVLIDGNPDSPATGPLQWEMVNGAQGALVMSLSFSTNESPFVTTSYYLDDSTPSGGSQTQCTGDGFAYGSSGPWINQAIPCTDPRLGCTKFMNAFRTMYYEAPGETVAEAQALNAKASTPLAFTAQAWTGVAATPTNTPPPTSTSTPAASPTPTPAALLGGLDADAPGGDPANPPGGNGAGGWKTLSALLGIVIVAVGLFGLRLALRRSRV